MIIQFIRTHKFLSFILCGLLVFFPYLGSVHLFDWDEANFAELAREMILTKNYLQPQINYLPFYEKPPLFIWFQVLSMKLFGINEFAARLPNALLGIIVMLSLFLIGKKEKNGRFGFLWVMTYFGSLLPFMYFRTGLIDPWFNYFMFLSLYFFYRLTKEPNRISNITLSSLFLGLAVQTKGPVALIIVCGAISITLLISRKTLKISIKKMIVWVILSIFFSSLWFLYETATHGLTYIREFFIYQIRLLTTEDALHGGPFYYHIIVLLFGCFPASFYLFNKTIYQENWKDNFFKMMIVTGVLVIILFSVVQTKIIHYSSMAYYPLSFIAAVSIYSNRKSRIKTLLLICLTIILILTIAILPILGVHLSDIKQFIHDPQTLNQLQTNVNWTYSQSIWGIIMLIIFVIAFRRLNDKQVLPFYTIPAIVLCFLLAFAPKIERYTQGVYIDFCKSMRGKDIYIQTLYLKSYAVYFYSNRLPFKNDSTKGHSWLYSGTHIDRPTYFITKTKDSVLKRHPRGYIHLYQQKNGFDILMRE